MGKAMLVFRGREATRLITYFFVCFSILLGGLSTPKYQHAGIGVVDGVELRLGCGWGCVLGFEQGFGCVGVRGAVGLGLCLCSVGVCGWDGVGGADFAIAMCFHYRNVPMFATSRAHPSVTSDTCIDHP